MNMSVDTLPVHDKGWKERCAGGLLGPLPCELVPVAGRNGVIL